MFSDVWAELHVSASVLPLFGGASRAVSMETREREAVTDDDDGDADTGGHGHY